MKVTFHSTDETYERWMYQYSIVYLSGYRAWCCAETGTLITGENACALWEAKKNKEHLVDLNISENA